MQKKYKTLLKDTFIFAIGNLGSKLILFVMVPLYTNFMTTDQYGTADLVFTVAQIIVPFLSVVIFDAVLRFGMSKFEKKENVVLIAFIVLGFTCLLSAAITPLVGLYKAISDWKWYMCIYVCLNTGVLIEQNCVKVKGKNKLYSIVSLLQTLVLASLNVLFLVYLKWTVKGYLLANIIAMAVAFIVLFVAGGLFKDLKAATFDKDLLKRMLIYSLPLILNNVSWWVIYSSDKIMLEVMISAAALGIYTTATKIPALINMIISIFSQAWGLSSIKETENSNSTEFYSNVFSLLTFLTFFACIAIVFVIKPFMNIYVGSEFSDAWQYVPLLLVSAVFSSISSYFGSLYAALKKSVNNMISTLIAAVVNIVVNYIFIIYVGVWGAVIGTAASYVVIAAIRLFDVLRYIKIKIPFLRLSLNCTIIIAQAILVSLDIYGYIVSAIATVLFLIINTKPVINSLKSIKGGKDA